MNQSEIILYKTEDGAVKIDTIFQHETIWLNQNSMAELFGVNVPAISKHLKNIFEEGELQKEATTSIMETVQGVKNVKAQFYKHFTILNKFDSLTMWSGLKLQVLSSILEHTTAHKTTWRILCSSKLLH